MFLDRCVKFTSDNLYIPITMNKVITNMLNIDYIIKYIIYMLKDCKYYKSTTVVYTCSVYNIIVFLVHLNLDKDLFVTCF